MFRRTNQPLQYHSDGQLVTLYDRSKSKVVKGSLLLVQRQLEKQVEEQKIEAEVVVEPSKPIPAPAPKPAKLTGAHLLQQRQLEKTETRENKREKSLKLPKLRLNKPQIKLSVSNKIGRFMASICLVLSLAGLIYTAAPVLGAMYLTKTAAPVEPPKGYLPIEMQLAQMTPVPTYKPVDLEDFYLSIPKINLDSKVMANVDMNVESDYQAKLLENGVAHAKGSYLPGEEGPVVLFAHSTDRVDHIVTYNAKFFAAKDLAAGDEIVVQFDHKVHRYQVVGQQVIDPNDLEVIRSSDADLILLTCYPPGTSWKRLLIFAKEI